MTPTRIVQPVIRVAKRERPKSSGKLLLAPCAGQEAPRHTLLLTHSLATPLPHSQHSNMAAASTPSKQLAALRGELDSLVCKVSGYERALQDVEMQVRTGLLSFCCSSCSSRYTTTPCEQAHTNHQLTLLLLLLLLLFCLCTAG